MQEWRLSISNALRERGAGWCAQRQELGSALPEPPHGPEAARDALAACAALSFWSCFGAKEIKGANIFSSGDKTDFSSSCALHTPCTYSTNI